jgi:hypothetical protein
MKLHKYANQDEYVKVQETWNKRKINLVWVSGATLDIVAEYIQKNMKDVRFGICHGTRRGVEQERLGELLGVEVIGTEISETATQFPFTIQWDFHNVKKEWLDNVSFIYSNSLDHSYDPDMAMKQWMSCLIKGGFCFIDWSKEHGEDHVNDLDCFGATLDEMRGFLRKFGEVEELPVVDQRVNHIVFVVKKL